MNFSLIAFALLLFSFCREVGADDIFNDRENGYSWKVIKASAFESADRICKEAGWAFPRIFNPKDRMVRSLLTAVSEPLIKDQIAPYVVQDATPPHMPLYQEIHPVWTEYEEMRGHWISMVNLVLKMGPFEGPEDRERWVRKLSYQIVATEAYFEKSERHPEGWRATAIPVPPDAQISVMCTRFNGSSAATADPLKQ